MSFYGMVDLLTVLPWWVDIFYPGDIMPTTFVRSFRLIKLFRSDMYACLERACCASSWDASVPSPSCASAPKTFI